MHPYLNILETGYQIVRLPACAVNRTKRLIKSPKLFWSDTGLALHLAGGVEPGGAHLENVVLADLISWRDVQPRRSGILYWRTAARQEVDFVVERVLMGNARWRALLAKHIIENGASGARRSLRQTRTTRIRPRSRR